uniref:Coatomer subunit epsilon n=1 Tax=Cacopsylla melanoneura TaxID=428564 RepID=A0A8D8PRQ2_9HEMI
MSNADSEVDELFDVRNSYYLGNYQQCIKEGQRLKANDSKVLLEKDFYVWRSYLAQKKYKVVLEEKLPEELSCVKILAEYFSNPSKRESILAVLDQENTSSDFHIICSASIYIEEGNYEAALRLLNFGSHLEIIALRIHTYLIMYRTDLALKELKLMQDRDEDNTLTQLCSAWVHIANNGDKLSEAYYTLQDLIDKYGTTPTLANAQAAVLLAQEKFEEAWDILQDCPADSVDTLVNNMVAAGRLGKGTEMYNRILSQLQDVRPKGKFLESYEEKAQDFDNLVAIYANK